MPRTEWMRLVDEARREGLSLKEAMRKASRAYRSANLHTYGNPSDPHERRRHERRQRIGELLRQGLPFPEAQRLVDRQFDRYQHMQKDLERSFTHPFSRENPRPAMNKWLIGALVVGGAWWLWRQNQVGAAVGPTQGQLSTNMPNAFTTGPASAPIIPIPAQPGGWPS
jgi:hypothetical protein